jgi:hypothetical protein
MKGLLQKDYYIVRGGVLMVGVMIGILALVVLAIMFALATTDAKVSAAVSSLASNMIWLFPVVLALMLSNALVTTISTDKVTQWDKFSATLPVSRAQIVSSKYFMFALLVLLGIAAGAIISIAASIYWHSYDTKEAFMYACLAVVLSLLPGSVNIPFAYLFDAEKSVIISILSNLLTAGAFIGAIRLLRYTDIGENVLLLYGTIAAFSVAAYVLSWRICRRIVYRKDI